MKKNDGIEIVAEIIFLIGYCSISILIYIICISDNTWGLRDVLFVGILGGIYTPFIAPKLRKYIIPKLIQYARERSYL